MSEPAINWAAIDADPRFQDLHRKKSTFLWSLMIFSVVYYFLLPIGAGYFPHLYATKIWGPINFGLLFALSQFIVAWAIAAIYARRANDDFDAMTAELVKRSGAIGAAK
jgi:uncharacterized membrane protein (DUF485 family)